MNWRDTEKRALSIAEERALEFSPIDKTELRTLAYQLGVDRLELRDMEEDAALIKRDDDKKTLFLNQRQSKVRHRFSMAHEIAHLLLEPELGNKSIHRRRFSPQQDPMGKRIEALCNKMASSIVMPRPRVLKTIEKTGWTARCIQNIQNEFDVSFEAAARRYINLFPKPCAMVFWRYGEDRRAVNTKSPISNENLGRCWIRLETALLQQNESAFKGETRNLVMHSKNIVSLWIGSRNPEFVGRINDVPMDSINRWKGEIASFVYFPSSVMDLVNRISSGKKYRHRT